MVYVVRATTASGGGVSIIVETAAAALAKLEEYREDGFAAIVLKDMDGKLVEAAGLVAGEGPLAVLELGHEKDRHFGGFVI